MPKFIALYGLKNLNIPFIEKDENGNVVRDETITFNKGQNGGRSVIPAYLHTNDPDKLKYLRSYPGNVKNGGSSYEEVKSSSESPEKDKSAKKPKEKVKTIEATKQTEPTPDPEQTSEPNVTNSDMQVFEDITNVPEASSKLRELFDDVTTKDTRTKKQINAVAEAKNVSFPNL